MIRVNLLEGTAEQRVSLQKTKVAARRGQQLFMLAAALLIFVIVIFVDHLWTNNAHASAKVELEKEEEQAKKLEADVKRKEDLENEMKQLDERIKVIKQLRAEQKGPVAMLSEINRRMPGGQADFRLLSITQKGDQVQIIGTSLDQQVIANFAKQLEFSNNLFSNLRLSVEGKEVKSDKIPLQEDPGEKKPVTEELVRLFQFTIDCSYNKPRAEGDTKEEKPATKAK
jgi:type IV pilus assembly protein PilN